MKRMLFNATHAEELRVAIVDGQRLIDLDIETAGREQRKSNIYKGVVTRIEPSLEACFVNYGEERHGFLPFKEIAREYFRPGVDVGRATIKEAIAEGTELLVQVEKEERGNKGAALTTFISLAGRYLVLMPNNPRGGGVSRRIEGEDRQELRETMDQLDVPSGMSLIARTAGIGRTAAELQWDLNYLLQLWRAVDDARKLQPGAYLIYQESSLVIRAIRDYFHPDIGEILIDTDDIYEQARQFMLHVMPDMGARVKRYNDDVPLFSRFQIEHQIETAYSRVVPLPSGGAIVIDHTEALVAVDVNSARATRGSDIEETAFRTNLEAAEEVGRQLRLRDLGGLIVIDFIDMESAKNQREVEQRLRDSLHVDRARVQMGKISRFGLMELSRQRLRPALNEGSHITCPRCNGTGVIRDVDSSALHILRILQEEAMKEGTAALHVQVPVEVATFLLNEKRTDIAKLEFRLKVTVVLIPNKFLETPNYKIERLRHDDPRLEDVRASYAMADEPAADAQYQQQKSDQTAAKPRQEAVVKGITPAQPAPVVPARAAEVTPAERGLFSRIMGWFSSGPSKSSAEEKTEARAERTDRGGRGRGRNERGSRNDGRDRRQNEREGRGGDRGDRSDRNESRSESRGEQREAREPRQQRQDGGRGRDQRRENRDAQNDARPESSNEQRADGRRERRSRPDAGERANSAASEVAAEAAITAPTEGAPQAEGADQERSGRRRRRRGRGGREGRRDDELAGNDAPGLEQPISETAFTATPAVAAAEVAATPSPEASATSAAPIAPISASEPVQVTASPIAAPALKTPAPMAPASPAPAPAPIQVSEETLRQSLDAVGLQWVQTDPGKSAAEAMPEPPPKLGRAPRRNTETAPQEPLVMVETRQNNP
ncbi:MAG: Rne/Rng family ribonuclease [Betaproteobacteria bacterium]|nr:Rne/Rng family ribonuclease [Betaproteobacteria bacterium]